MTEPEKKPEDEMSMEEALSAIRKLISEDDIADIEDDADEDEDLAEELEALSERLEEALSEEDEAEEAPAVEEPEAAEATEVEEVAEPAEPVAEDVAEEPAFIEEAIEETEVLELEAHDLEPLDLDEAASLLDGIEGGEPPALDIDDIPKFLTELRQALGEVEKAAEEEVLPLSADMELHRDREDERSQQQPADEEEEAPPVIPDIREEKVAVPMNQQGEDRILSPEAAMKASSAFDNLSSLVTSGYEGEDNTLEGLVKTMMRPLLREWLDQNLPRIVEEKVEAEIRKLSRSSGA